MPTYRSTFAPWFFLIVAGLAGLLGSGDLSARDTGNRVFVWLIAAAVVTAIQNVRPMSREQSDDQPSSDMRS
ncbi:hypothetical protein [Williamsia muralis]|uniref:Uncharacterized protein n=1 Tax=Williamsia marianensis TaxID=85044 RepID=A0A2G3PLU4_WILMA|nr:hypothetical protein [Williamsia marianensis]PHV66726.1 hypothetical protein CSW57_10625 [Williamsia marianensis]